MTKKGNDKIALELTPGECNLLFDAVEAWEQQPVQKGLVGMIISGVAIPDRDKAKACMHEEGQKSEAEALTRKRRAIIVKAKLMQALEDNTAELLFSGKD